MSEQMHESNQDLILKLDAQRQKEIEGVRTGMENFLRGQIALEHKLELVAANQNGLKERFEEGVSKTLKNLDHKFDQFMIEWGKKEAEDTARDKAIQAATKSAEVANSRTELIYKGFTITILASLSITGIVWGISKLLIHSIPAIH